jgi:hypothetical protein
MGGFHLAEGTPLDNAIHVVTTAVALTLFLLSWQSYRRLRRSRFRYVCLAFFIFALKEAIVVLDVLLLQDAIVTAVSHLLNLVVLALFFAGVTAK